MHSEVLTEAEGGSEGNNHLKENLGRVNNLLRESWGVSIIDTNVLILESYERGRDTFDKQNQGWY